MACGAGRGLGNEKGLFADLSLLSFEGETRDEGLRDFCQVVEKEDSVAVIISSVLDFYVPL